MESTCNPADVIDKDVTIDEAIDAITQLSINVPDCKSAEEPDDPDKSETFLLECGLPGLPDESTSVEWWNAEITNERLFKHKRYTVRPSLLNLLMRPFKTKRKAKSKSKNKSVKLSQEQIPNWPHMLDIRALPKLKISAEKTSF